MISSFVRTRSSNTDADYPRSHGAASDREPIPSMIKLTGGTALAGDFLVTSFLWPFAGLLCRQDGRAVQGV